MAYEAGALESALSAAAGDDPELMRDLRASFVHSLATQLDLLGRARCDGNWLVAARRLQGLGASFHEQELAQLAQEAAEGVPGDPVVLRRLAQYAEKFTQG
jgi:HPt (histidine-containing phosphotransfer) domain-containing protein